MTRGLGDNVKEMIKYSMFPVYIRFRDDKLAGDYKCDLVKKQLAHGMMSWDKGSEDKMINKPLSDMAVQQCPRITNIVCIGHGSLGRSSDSMFQHIAASPIAEKLMALYEDLGKPLAAPIDIVAQDPSYTANDKHLLSLLPRPICVVTDPEGFLAINENSLVVSCCPAIPVKQIVADLAADWSFGKGPAAVIWNNSSWDEKHGGVDVVTYP